MYNRSRALTLLLTDWTLNLRIIQKPSLSLSIRVPTLEDIPVPVIQVLVCRRPNGAQELRLRPACRALDEVLECGELCEVELQAVAEVVQELTGHGACDYETVVWVEVRDGVSDEG